MAKGPFEPAWCRLAREDYWRGLFALRDLEDRVCLTEAGMAWFYRVRERTRPQPLHPAIVIELPTGEVRVMREAA